MARATYIYVIKPELGKDIRGLFTVKHEAISYMKRNPKWCEDCKLFRTRDGETYDLTEVDIG